MVYNRGMKLYIMRHGHAEPLPDAEGHRHLSSQGRKELAQLAVFLREKQFQVSQIQHSEKTRARETAEIIGAGFCLTQNKALNPEADLDKLLMQLEAEQEDILLVSHMPLVSELVGCLVAKNPRYDLIAFSPGTVVCLEKYNERWLIDWVLRHPL